MTRRPRRITQADYRLAGEAMARDIAADVRNIVPPLATPTGASTWHGVYYFPSFVLARAYAHEHSHPADRIIPYSRGWAIQLSVSGPYVGPKDEALS